MTNGEKIKEVFPDSKIITQYDNPFGDRFMVFTLNNEDMQVNIEWWNAEYKEPSSEGTTKCPCYDCEYFEKEGLSHCKIYEGAYGDCRCNNYHKVNQSSTTKNDLPHCQCTDEEIAKSFIEDVEAVKDKLPCGEQMDFPNTFDEFAEDYGFKDKDEIYTNGLELIPVYRVKQWLEHITPIRSKGHWIETNDYFTGAYESIDYVECSCCHADSLEEGNYCPNCGAEMESEG